MTSRTLLRLSRAESYSTVIAALRSYSLRSCDDYFSIEICVRFSTRSSEFIVIFGRYCQRVELDVIFCIKCQSFELPLSGF